jgi:6,7-dimethyl-8-ribityllumazine synthase
MTGSNTFSASLDGSGKRFAIVAARFNEEITDSLLEGAAARLAEHGVAPEDIDAYRVPGAWELPQTAARLVRRGSHDGVIALGCVIRGETPHFDYVAGEAAYGLGAVARASEIPVVFGVLTTDTREQAERRADPHACGMDKGGEVASAAVEMVLLFEKLP